MITRRGCTTLAAIGLLALAAPVPAQAADAPEKSDPTELVSLVSLAPETVWMQKRYPKFYGDPKLNTDTIDGGVLDRQYLLGSFGGARTTWAENGVGMDLGVTQVVQSVVSGDSDDDVNYVGSADLWLGLDAGLAGLWSGGLILAHLEGNWGDPVSGTGALLPLNGDAIMPDAPSSIALSEIFITQALSEQVTVIAGKFNVGDLADKSLFANEERTQFLNEGLVNNPMFGAFVPYTAWAAVLSTRPMKDIGIGAGVLQNAGSATVTGFNDLRADELTFVGTFGYYPNFNGLPGIYEMLLGLTTKDAPSFAIDEQYLFGEFLGLLPVVDEEENYGLTINASQYLWVDEEATERRGDGATVGIGLFLRFGIGPDDRNAIDQFYSFGVGGWGGPFGRANDNWGVGWAGSHISSDLRSLSGGVGLELDVFEHALEGFYNFGLTPASHLSLHVQYIDPFISDADDLVILGTRLQLDF